VALSRFTSTKMNIYNRLWWIFDHTC